MPSTYTTNNGIELIGTGEQSGTWGETTNTNFGLIDTALDGQLTKTLASAGTSGSPNTLIIEDGTTSDGRNRLVIFNDGADLGGTAYVQLTPDNAEKIMFVRNSLSGDRSIIFFQGTYNASNDFELPNGTDAVIKFDGAGTGAVVEAVFKKLYLQDLLLDTSSAQTMYIESTIPTFNMKETDADLNEKFWRLQTSAGVFKVDAVNDAYDTAATAYSVDRSGVTPNLHIWYSNASEAMRVTSAGNVGIGTSTPATALDVNGTVTAAGLTATTADINGGTIDGVTIGGASAGAGTFTSVTGTSLDMNGNADFGGNITLSQASSSTIKRSDNTGLFSIQGGNDALSTSLVMYGNAHASLSNWTVMEADTMLFRPVDDSPEFLRFVDGTGAVFNETGADVDFRIESDTLTHAFFLQGSDGNIGIGTGSPAEKLEVTGNIVLDATDANIKIKSGVAGTAGAVNFTFNSDSTVYGSLSLPYDTRSSVGLLAQSGSTYPVSIASGTTSSATNAVILSTSGEEALRVDYLGRVGIGTSSPRSQVHIYGAGQATANLADAGDMGGILRVSATGFTGGSGGGIIFANLQSDDTQTAGMAAIKSLLQDGANNTTGSLAFSLRAVNTDTALTERMRLTKEGYVGIGDSAPPSILSVRGNTPESRITNTNPISDSGGTEEVARLGVYAQKNSIYGPAANIVFRQDGATWSAVDQYHKGTRIEFCTQTDTATDTSETPRMVIDKDGNVGIGTDNPSARLDVNGAAEINDTLLISRAAVAPKITFENSSYAGGDGSIGYFNSGALTFDTNAAERMRIDSSGNVGIGTSSPQTHLHVDAGTKNYTGTTPGLTSYAVSIESGSTGTCGIGIGSHNNIPSIQGFGGGTGYNLALCPANGSVAIGHTSPSQALDVVGNIEVSGGIYLGGTAAANLLDDYEEGTWTPAFTPSSGAFGSISYAFATGAYTKVGRLVTVTGRLQLDATAPTIGTASGNLYISGLPFSAATGQEYYATMSFTFLTGFNVGTAPSSAFVSQNTTVAQVRSRAASNDPETTYTPADLVSSGASSGLMFSATYYTT